jgi:AcrR family transcriptional regulator
MWAESVQYSLAAVFHPIFLYLFASPACIADSETMNAMTKTLRNPKSKSSSRSASPRAAGEAANALSIPIEPPSAQSPLETRSIILLCAARLLRENGYAAVSLRQIANEAGIRASTIYYHFESKEEILFHVLEEGLRVIVHEVNKGVATMPAGLSFHERLRIVVRSHLHGLLQVGDFSSANIRIYGQVPEDVRLRHVKSRNAYGKWWTEFLKQGVAEGAISPKLNLGVARIFIVGALNWTVEWYDPRRGSFDAFADNVCMLVSGGLVRA